MARERRRDSNRVPRRALLGTGAAVLSGSIAGCPMDGSGTTSEQEQEQTEGSLPESAVSQFRADRQGTGYVPDQSVPESVDRSWRERGINKWTHTAAKGSPIVADSDIYVGGDTGAVYSVALDGVVNWGTATWPSARGTHGTPAVTEEAVYIGAYDGAMYAFSREDGSLKWRTEIGDAIGSSPRYADGTIYVSVETTDPSGIMAVLDAGSGEIEWTDDRVTDHPHSSVALDPETGMMTVGANDGVLYGWDRDSLEFRWQFEVAGTNDADRKVPIKGPIAVHDGAAFFGSWDQYVYRVDLETGEADWRFETEGFVMSGAGVDPRSSRVYIGSHDGHLYCLDGATGEEQWRFATGGQIVGCPVIAGETVLIGSYDTTLYALDRRSGDRQWSFEADGWVTSSPAVADGSVVFTDRADIDNPDQARGNQAGSLWVLEESARSD